jgi:hypothetical protein
MKKAKKPIIRKVILLSLMLGIAAIVLSINVLGGQHKKADAEMIRDIVLHLNGGYNIKDNFESNDIVQSNANIYMPNELHAYSSTENEEALPRNSECIAPAKGSPDWDPWVETGSPSGTYIFKEGYKLVGWKGKKTGRVYQNTCYDITVNPTNPNNRQWFGYNSLFDEGELTAQWKATDETFTVYFEEYMPQGQYQRNERYDMISDFPADIKKVKYGARITKTIKDPLQLNKRFLGWIYSGKSKLDTWGARDTPFIGVETTYCDPEVKKAENALYGIEDDFCFGFRDDDKNLENSIKSNQIKNYPIVSNTWIYANWMHETDARFNATISKADIDQAPYKIDWLSLRNDRINSYKWKDENLAKFGPVFNEDEYIKVKLCDTPTYDCSPIAESGSMYWYGAGGYSGGELNTLQYDWGDDTPYNVAPLVVPQGLPAGRYWVIFYSDCEENQAANPAIPCTKDLYAGDRFEIYDKIPKVKNVRVTNIRSGSVRVEWDKPDVVSKPEIDHYEVLLCPTAPNEEGESGGCWIYEVGGYRYDAEYNNGGKNTFFDLKRDLVADTEYRVEVVTAFSNEGNLNDPVSSAPFRTRAFKKPEPVKNLRIVDHNSKDITIAWDAYDEDANPDAMGFVAEPASNAKRGCDVHDYYLPYFLGSGLRYLPLPGNSMKIIQGVSGEECWGNIHVYTISDYAPNITYEDDTWYSWEKDSRSDPAIINIPKKGYTESELPTCSIAVMGEDLCENWDYDYSKDVQSTCKAKDCQDLDRFNWREYCKLYQHPDTPSLRCTQNPVVNSTKEKPGFKDTSGSFAKKSIDWIYSKGITSGTTKSKYSPKKAVTREEMSTFIRKLSGFPKEIKASSYFPFSFGDVSENRKSKYFTNHYNDIHWLNSVGITAGVDKTHFAPRKSITRGQLAVFLWTLDGKPRNYIPSQLIKDKFTDLKGQPEDFKYAIWWLFFKGVVKGVSKDKFDPKASVTREQMAVFLQLYHDNIMPDKKQDYIIGNTKPWFEAPWHR